MGKETFFTRGPANTGIKLPLIDPRTGKETEHWLQILGRDSDVFRKAEADSRRRVVESIRDLEPNDKKGLAAKLEQVEEEETRNLIAVLVAAWSFDDPCTPKNVADFLKEAPQIADAIDQVATKRRLFFEGVSSSSPGTPKPSSDSTSDLTAASKPSEPT